MRIWIPAKEQGPTREGYVSNFVPDNQPVPDLAAVLAYFGAQDRWRECVEGGIFALKSAWGHAFMQKQMSGQTGATQGWREATRRALILAI